MNFRQSALSGVKWTGLSSAANAILKLIQFAVLAHYLTPSDFGLMAIVMTIIGFSALFVDFGISAAIIHRQDISKVQLSSLYWLNIFVSLLLFLIVYSLAPWIVVFYGEPELLPIIRLLAVTFIISGVGNQFAILLQKELQFRHLASISILSVVSSFVVALVLAIQGYGVYSLVYATLFGSVVSSFFNILLGLRLHRPQFVFRMKEIEPMISFGFFQMGERSVNYVNAQFDILLIGKIFGTEVLGIYSIAKTISMKPYQMINPIVNKVTFPIMSKVQEDDNRLRKIFLSAINYLCSVNFPIYILIILLADGIIITFFGEKWAEAIVILQVLAAYRMFTSFGNPIGTLQLAKGRADLGFYWNLALFTFIPVVVYLGSAWGVLGVAFSLLILQILLFYPAWFFLVNPLAKVSLSSYSVTIFKPFVIAFIGGGLGLLLVWLLGIEDFLLSVVVHGLAMALVVYELNKKYNQDFASMLFDFLNHRK